jgi:nitrate reductase gamma subunit
VADPNPLFKLDLFLGMTIFLVFPSTRLVHVWSAPIWYLGRHGYQIVRTKTPVSHARLPRGASSEPELFQARRLQPRIQPAE